MASFSGQFYFKLTEEGNLLGEYSHQGTSTIRPECAMRVTGAKNDYAGDFLTAWYEQNTDNAMLAGLRVRPKPQDSHSFTLLWMEHKTSRILFTGEATLKNGAIVGHYALPTSNLNS